MNELEFFVEETPEGTFLARSCGACMITEASSLDELRNEIQDLVCCHFEEGCSPTKVLLRFIRIVREEEIVFCDKPK